jgi:hypothetical protein
MEPNNGCAWIKYELQRLRVIVRHGSFEGHDRQLEGVVRLGFRAAVRFGTRVSAARGRLPHLYVAQQHSSKGTVFVNGSGQRKHSFISFVSYILTLIY